MNKSDGNNNTIRLRRGWNFNAYFPVTEKKAAAKS